LFYLGTVLSRPGLKPIYSKMADFGVYLHRQYACNQKTNGEFWYSKTIPKFCPDRFLELPVT